MLGKRHNLPVVPQGHFNVNLLRVFCGVRLICHEKVYVPSLQGIGNLMPHGYFLVFRKQGRLYAYVRCLSVQ